MECTDAKLRMEPYATGNLSSPDREAFEAHVEHCEGCRLELELTRALSGSIDPEEPGAAGASHAEAAASQPVAAEGTSASPRFEDAAAPLGAASDLPAPAEPPPAGAASGSPSPVDAEISFADVAPRDDSSSSDFSLDALLASALPSVASTMPEPAAPAPDPLANINIAPPPPARGRTPPAAPTPAASWDFEPADAKPHSLPPEGSLFFAEEALTRTRDADEKRKSAMVRTALWIAGGLVGVGLLLFAGWIALSPHPNGQDSAGAVQPPESIANGAPEAAPAAGESGQGAVQPNAVEPAPQRAAAPPEQAAVTGTGSQAMAEPGQETPVVQAGAGDARSPLPEPQSTPPARHGTPPARQAKGTSAAPRAAVKPHAPRVAGTAANGVGAAPRPSELDAPSPAVPRTGAAGTDATAHRAAEAAPPDAAAPEASRQEPGSPPAPPETASAPAKPGPAGPPPAGGDSPAQPASPTPGAPRPTGDAESAAAASATGATSTPPGAGTHPAPASGASPAASPTAPEPAGTAPARPIDRIHAATVAAEDRDDLEALRNLRDRWRTFIQRTGVGADRARAKRELADCLWAIQSLTARHSDQREALQAYRDYILNAPAGGADTRSISRARQLEDALSESR
jgi:hypothetical protein